MPFKEDEAACPLTNLVKKIAEIEKAQGGVVVYGEIFGAGVQDMGYGQQGKSFRIFDIAVDGRYLDWEKVKLYVEADSALQLVPILYQGPYSLGKMDELVDGPTTICKAEDIKEPFKGREGVVIKPVRERVTETFSRAILKYVSVDYHNRKNKNQTEGH